ncbi:MAG: leucine-rich repeat domain-containing protein [Sporocytophaga sp.]|uniref:leucine-rich repeat domain-containing protein n=1 Tax=Sporocytophaga sp. TaxID=2231183 RepID=UPI001B2A451D|nr:leucine-rich repeat domain-containing protein [Sporocytophaga sp.]MBO9703607.1 leucine-rich repeat domain-containing protein [Sporocytophaga sp.]
MRIFFGLIFILTMQLAYGQRVSLPDVNLMNKLKANYPQVMQGDQLDIEKAADLTGALDLRNANISDATGIQYFTGIASLNLSNNQITTIPDISGITGLVDFYASDNKLVTIPSMASLTKLGDFQVMNNQLTELPDLSGAKGLWFLYCSQNKITALPPLSQFPNLTRLVIGENPFINPIDFSPCTNLEELHIHKTGIDTIIGLDKLKKLTTLFAWENNIRNLSGLDSNTTLTLCMVFNNPLNTLPYFSNKPDLNYLNVFNCLLTFEDIIPVLQKFPAVTFVYEPQLPIPFQNITARAENNFTLKYPIDNPHPGNWYVWIKNGEKLDSSASPTFTFSPLTFPDSGIYLLKVYNPTASSLILKSDTFKINVKPCVELPLTSVSILSKECGKGYTIDLSNIQITGGTNPFTYELNNGFQRKKYSEKVIENIAAGEYKITIIDSKNCTATDKFSLNRIEKCDPVITPNGDNIADTYYIEHSGKVEIYDLKRRLVNTFEAPIVWDGTDQNGTLLDAGYYIITIEGQNPVYLTIIR